MKTLFLSLLSIVLFSCNNKQPIQKATDEFPLVNEEIIEEADDGYIGYQEPSINLFDLQKTEKQGVAFFSLSDIYNLVENFDSLATPNVEGLSFVEAQYFHLAAKHRHQFLSKTGVLPADSVFVYDYASNSLTTFLVDDLHVVAVASPYVGDSDMPLSQHDYMIGFEIVKENLKGFEDDEYFIHSLVYVGKENPFAQEQLTAIVWNKIASEKYPSKEIKGYNASYLKGSTMGDTYLFETDSLQYFLQNYHSSEDRNIYDTLRRLLVVEKSTKDIILDKFLGMGEGTSPSSLNNEDEYKEIHQWTGKLLKDKAPVVFGFEYISFGCPFISVLDRSGEDIFLYCDNRH